AGTSLTSQIGPSSSTTSATNSSVIAATPAMLLGVSVGTAIDISATQAEMYEVGTGQTVQPRQIDEGQHAEQCHRESRPPRSASPAAASVPPAGRRPSPASGQAACRPRTAR